MAQLPAGMAFLLSEQQGMKIIQTPSFRLAVAQGQITRHPATDEQGNFNAEVIWSNTVRLPRMGL